MRTLIEDIVLDVKNTISGFVENVRDKKTMCFLVVRDVSSKIQITIDKVQHPEFQDIIDRLTIDSVVQVSGVVRKSDFVKLNGIEMFPDDIQILSIAATSPIIAPNEKETNIDLRLDYRWIDLRSDKNLLMFKVQSEFIRACRDFLYRNNFIEIHTPKIIGTESESGAGVFKVDYFGRTAYLAQSPQFYKQMAMAAGFERIFESGPVFRAEKSHSHKHSTEFSGFDIEFSYIESYRDVMEMEEKMLTFAMCSVADKYSSQIKNLYNTDIVVPSRPFPCIDLHELYDELERRYEYHVNESDKGDLTTEGEKLCARFSLEKYGHEFLFVTGFSKDKRAFYHMRDSNGIPCGYDLIWKGCEITTGAQREHRYDILKKQAEEKGLVDDVKFYLDFFKYGCPPHGGFGIGIDRMTMLLFNTNIKEGMFIFRGPERLNP